MKVKVVRRKPLAKLLLCLLLITAWSGSGQARLGGGSSFSSGSHHSSSSSRSSSSGHRYSSSSSHYSSGRSYSSPSSHYSSGHSYSSSGSYRSSSPSYSSANSYRSTSSNGYTPSNSHHSPTNHGYTPPNSYHNPTSQGYTPSSSHHSPTNHGYTPPASYASPPNQDTPTRAPSQPYIEEGPSDQVFEVAGLIGLCFLAFVAVAPIAIVLIVAATLWKMVGRPTSAPTAPDLSGPRQELGLLRQHDPNFSVPVFQSYANLLFSCLHQSRGNRQMDLVAGRFAPAVLREVEGDASLVGVANVVVGSQKFLQYQVREPEALMRIVVAFEACYDEHLINGQAPIYTQEEWTFSKSLSTLSQEPEALLRFACPNCGQSTGTSANGVCTSCQQPTNQQRLGWIVTDRQVVAKVAKPPLVFDGPGQNIEAGTEKPTLYPPDHPSQLRAFSGRHPDFNWSQFERRVTAIFINLQEAWSSQQFSAARPFEMDTLYDTHRFWIERYQAEGYTNYLQEIQVESVVPCLVEMDAFYERIVVRIFAQMKDWTCDRQGQIVSGDPNQLRRFSEYWTFLRRVGSATPIGENIHTCPSCGARLDNVNQNGICLYCRSHITSGSFDWVLSNIDQDESYKPT